MEEPSVGRFIWQACELCYDYNRGGLDEDEKESGGFIRCRIYD